MTRRLSGGVVVPGRGTPGEVRPDPTGEGGNGRTTSTLLSAEAVAAARCGGRAIAAQVTDAQWLAVARVLAPVAASAA